MVPVSDFTFSNSEVNSVRTCSTSLESLDMVPAVVTRLSKSVELTCA